MTKTHLKKRISKLEKKFKDGQEPRQWSGWFSVAWRVAIDWGSGVLIGYLAGSALDYILTPPPWGVILCLLLGNVAGVLNIYRTYQKHLNTF